MQITKKNILLSIIFIFMAYCAVDIGSMWDSGTHLSMGQNRLDYLFSLGAVNNEYWFSKFFPGISYTITAFLLNVFPKALETEVLHLINLSISLSAAYGLTNICKILFNKQISRIVFVIFLLFPTYFGHASINPKDTVVAVSYIWLTYFILKYIKKSFKTQNNNSLILKIAFFLALGSGVRLAFASLLLPLLFFVFIEIFYFKKIINKKEFSLKLFFFDFLKIVLFSYFILVLFWPQAHPNIFIEPFKIFLETIDAPPVGPPAGLLNGNIYLAKNTPNNYVILNLIFKTPEYILLLYLYFIFFVIKYNYFFSKKITNFNYKLFLIILVLSLTNILFILSPYPMYDGMRLILFMISFFVLIPGLAFYFLINHYSYLKFKIMLIPVFFLFAIFIVKFLSLTPYQYVYLNYLNGKTINNYSKFENDYLTTSLKELIKKSSFLNNESAKITFCGMGRGKIKKYLKKYNYSKVRVVRWEENYDYMLLTNRVDWTSIDNLNKAKTCFESFMNDNVSTVERNGLILSAVQKK